MFISKKRIKQSILESIFKIFYISIKLLKISKNILATLLIIWVRVGKSKKQAEIKATKVAYSAFKDCKSLSLCLMVSMTFVSKNQFLFSIKYYKTTQTRINLLSKFKHLFLYLLVHQNLIPSFFFYIYMYDLMISMFAKLLFEIAKP